MANGDETDASRFTARSLALRVGLLLVLLGLVAWLLTDLVPGSGTRLANARTGWVIAEVVLEVIACAGYAALFHATFSYGEYRIPSLRSAQIAVGALSAEISSSQFIPKKPAGTARRAWAHAGRRSATTSAISVHARVLTAIEISIGPRPPGR